MPEAHAILWFMGVFLGLWGLSLIARGLVGERTGRGRLCPSCGKSLPAGTLACAACGCEARSERAVRSRQRNGYMIGGGSGSLLVAAGALLAGGRVYTWTHQ